jgi:hypothetical protein
MVILITKKARLRAEPSLLDSAIVALHAHGGDIPAQGFHRRRRMPEHYTIGPAIFEVGDTLILA